MTWKKKYEKVIVLCDSYPQAEFEFGCFVDFLANNFETVNYINNAALMLVTEDDIQYKFMSRRWFPFIEKDLDYTHTEITNIDDFVEDCYGVENSPRFHRV